MFGFLLMGGGDGMEVEFNKKIQKNKKTLNQLKNNIEKVKIIENHNKFKSLNDITAPRQFQP